MNWEAWLRPHGRFILTTVDTIFREPDFRRYTEAFENAPDDIDGMMAVTSHIDDEKPLYVETDGDMGITAFIDTPGTGLNMCQAAYTGWDAKPWMSSTVRERGCGAHAKLPTRTCVRRPTAASLRYGKNPRCRPRRRHSKSRRFHKIVTLSEGSILSHMRLCQG